MCTHFYLFYHNGSGIWAFLGSISNQTHVVILYTLSPSVICIDTYRATDFVHICKCLPLLRRPSKCFNSQNRLFFWCETILFFWLNTSSWRDFKCVLIGTMKLPFCFTLSCTYIVPLFLVLYYSQYLM